ncbi:MAG: hypothetical protein II852_01760 [Bacteroidales bacterium]|jgi:hypothetical protein|nr:hypothetical protein [Bacteroidales bacterium]
MADITVKEGNTGALTPVSEVDLAQITNTTLINELVSNGALAQAGENLEWRLIGKDNVPIQEPNRTLAELGFVDGDTITVIAKPAGAN